MRDEHEQLQYPSNSVVEFTTQGVDFGSRKKRKLAKNYPCPEEDCDKIYSRAEHLYRHQLNHTPKHIYRCDLEGCDRSFVRKDLCSRHRERHSKTNSNLSRRDAIKAGRKAAKARGPTPKKELAHTTHSLESLDSPTSERQAETEPNVELPVDFTSITPDPTITSSSPGSREPETAVAHQYTQSEKSASSEAITEADLQTELVGPSVYTAFGSEQHDLCVNIGPPIHQYQPHQRLLSDSALSVPQIPALSLPSESPHVVELYNMNHQTFGQEHPRNYIPPLYPPIGPGSGLSPGAGISGFPADIGNMQLTSSIALPGVNLHSAIRADSVTSRGSKNFTRDQHQSNIVHNSSSGGITLMSQQPGEMTLQMFDNGTFDNEPFDIGGPFWWLFSNEQQEMLQSPYLPSQTNESYTDDDGRKGSRHALACLKAVHQLPIPPPILSVLDSGQPELLFSESRRKHLLGMIRDEFRDNRHIDVNMYRERILRGNHDDDSHILSLRMFQVYISSFWSHIHAQLPIMHRSTFSAETCPDLLLLAIIALGASCVEKTHGDEAIQACAELSFFLAFHIRHRIFQDPDASPPAKLWVFQSLLLLEVFEKLFSKRSLHERAHVHHATTITLMRRGSSLVGRSAADVASDYDPTRTPPGPDGSINTSGVNTQDAWWNHWISSEATRRTAFAAFIIDTTHATMFGHSAVMVAHEMRIPLPCDEQLWSARSGAEVYGLEQSLTAKGLKPVSFLEGLKRTLNGRSVRTNTFGRVAIMAGLLSVSWHMKMQDVRVSSIGVGKKGSWASQLTQAFDHWKFNFDASLATTGNVNFQIWNHPNGLDVGNVFESRTVLHHLAHMAMHVDIIDCQILAGAKYLLGRTITVQEHAVVAKRMRESWAPSERARDATFYALRFLREVLTPEGSGSTQQGPPGLCYSARDDNLLNRPWMVYFATLIVWSYGYSLDGPMAPPSYKLGIQYLLPDLQQFLKRVGGVKSPEDLQNVKHRNHCLGLLLVLGEMFLNTRWELLHEASARLHNCAELLMPGKY